jgi:hypothetical protein
MKDRSSTGLRLVLVRLIAGAVAAVNVSAAGQQPC